MLALGDHFTINLSILAKKSAALSVWATTVMGQELPWTNVCDTKGFASQYASLYNLQVLPSSFVISDGELIDGGAVDADSFETLLKKLLK